MDANKNFTYEKTETVSVKRHLDPGIHTTYCRDCNRTCHDDCGIPSDEDKAGCIAMDSDGNCGRCPKSCHWSNHSNVPYVVEL